MCVKNLHLFKFETNLNVEQNIGKLVIFLCENATLLYYGELGVLQVEQISGEGGPYRIIILY